MRGRMLAAAIVFALAAASCGGDKAGQTPAAPGSMTAPTAAPTASAQASVPGDWKEFRAHGATLRLPPAFVGGEIDAAGKTVASIKALGPQCARSTESVQRLLPVITFLAVDSRRCSEGFVTNVVMTEEGRPAGASALDYLDAVERFLPRSYDVRTKQAISLGGRHAAEMSIDADLGAGAQFGQEYFAVPGDGVTWSIIFTAGTDEFENDRGLFREIASTFDLP